MKALIIIPTYNRSGLILNAINSIISQDHKNWHLVVSDDCSTDDTYEKIKPIIETNDKISYIKNKENLGTYRTQNAALKFASENIDGWDFFTNFGSDDYCNSNYLNFNLNLFNNPETISLRPCISRVPHVDFNFSFPINRYYLQWPCGIVFYRRKVFNMIGYFDDTRFSGDSEYNQRLEKYIQLSGTNYKTIKTPSDKTSRHYFALDHPSRLGRAEETHLQSSARNHYRSKYNTKIHLTKNKDDLKYSYC